MRDLECMCRAAMFRLDHYSSSFFVIRRELEEFAESDACVILWKRHPLIQTCSIMALIENYDAVTALPRLPPLTPPLQRKFDRPLSSDRPLAARCTICKRIH
eukprot:7594800-Pyramimonas_sp.AAC.1